MTLRNAVKVRAVYCSSMLALLAYLGVAVAVVAVAWVCNLVLEPRLSSGRISHGQASAVTLLALLIAPTLAASIATAALVSGGATVYGAALYFYAGYAVGLVCFIVLNRRFRRIGRDG